MKKLLFVLFFVLSASVMAKESLQELLKDQKIDLTQGITLKDAPPFHDFSTFYTNPVFPLKPYNRDFVWYDETFGNAWYSKDFAADPFDGRIEVLVMGEPLPSTTITFLISIALVDLLLYRNKFRVVV